MRGDWFKLKTPFRPQKLQIRHGSSIQARIVSWSTKRKRCAYVQHHSSERYVWFQVNYVLICLILCVLAIADAIRTSLGPRGMDKMIQAGDGSVTISNDGATIMSQMDVYHPTAKMLVELSKSQDIEAGDGTTSVCILAGALLSACEQLLQKGIHPTKISESFGLAALKANDILTKMAQPVDLNDREGLINCVNTSLSSKVISEYSDRLSPITVDAVLAIIDKDQAENADLKQIKVSDDGWMVDETILIVI